jgi:imidazolonepropionase-like amidohydrolase
MNKLNHILIRSISGIRLGKVILAAALVWAMPLAAQTVTLLRDATIHTVTKGTFKGSILIRDGKIAEVGPAVQAPAGATVVDVSGKHIIPGIIDCHSHSAIESINEGSMSVSSMVGVADNLDPESIALFRALAGGVTTANILHGSANAIGGLNVVVKMRWGKDAEGLLFEGAPPGIKLALGENPKRQGSTPVQRYPATRMGVEDVIREAFTEARAYQKAWKDYEAAKARGERVIPPRRDLKLEPLVEVLEGKRMVHAHCYRADEILMLLRLAEELGFKIQTLQHVLEGYKVADEIAAHGAGASTFSDWWAYKVEAYDAIPYNAAIMQKRGVLVSLNSDSDELMRRLNTEAGKMLKYGGLSKDEALAMVTYNPAKQLGIDHRVGSIEVGKDADLVVYDKEPLSVYARVQQVYIDGQLYFDREKDLQDREKHAALWMALLEEDAARQKGASAGGAKDAATTKPSGEELQ